MLSLKKVLTKLISYVITQQKKTIPINHFHLPQLGKVKRIVSRAELATTFRSYIFLFIKW